MAELFHRRSQLATRSVDPAVGGRWIASRLVLNQLFELVEYFRALLLDTFSSAAWAPCSLAIPVNLAILQLPSRLTYRRLRKTGNLSGDPHAAVAELHGQQGGIPPTKVFRHLVQHLPERSPPRLALHRTSQLTPLGNGRLMLPCITHTTCIGSRKDEMLIIYESLPVPSPRLPVSSRLTAALSPRS